MCNRNTAANYRPEWGLVNLTEAKIRASHHAETCTELQNERLEPNPIADSLMCQALLMELCRLDDGQGCDAWWFCHTHGCEAGPTQPTAHDES